MSNRRAIVLGLFSGIATALVAGALVVALAPDAGPGGGGSAASPIAPASGSVGSGTPAATGQAAGGQSGPGAPAGSDGSGPSASGGPSGPGTPASPPDDSPSGAFHVGEPAPPLRVPQLGGGTVDLEVLRGHPVWIEFMATWCPSCRDEFPDMSGFAARYAGQGLVVVAVDVHEDEGAVAAFVNQLGPTFPIGLDTDGKAAAAWGAVGLPTHFFVDASGIVRDGAVGGIGPDIMAASLRTIMPGVNVTP